MHTRWLKIRLTHFGLSGKAFLLFAFIRQTNAKFDENGVDRPGKNTDQSGSVGSR